jgi:hypothetical protein
MAIDFKRRLDQETEQKLCGFYATLSEKDQRRFAAIEATQLGHGGIKYVAQLLGCSTRTIERGIAELDDLPNDPAEGRVRGPVVKKDCRRLASRAESERVARHADCGRSRRRSHHLYGPLANDPLGKAGRVGHSRV